MKREATRVSTGGSRVRGYLSAGIVCVLEHAYVCMRACVHQKVLEKASEQCDCVCGYL